MPIQNTINSIEQNGASSSGSGSSSGVTGPVSAVNLRVVVFDGITGQIIKDNGSVTIDGSGNLLIGASVVTGKVTIKGNGLTTGHAFSVTDSGGTERSYITDAGPANFGTSVTSGTFYGSGGQFLGWYSNSGAFLAYTGNGVIDCMGGISVRPYADNYTSTLGDSTHRWYQGLFQATGIRIGDGTNGWNITTHGTTPNENFRIGQTATGTGAFYLGPVVDSTAVGGNARGTTSVDLQLLRNASTQVSSGTASFTAGAYNKASSNYSVAIGYNNESTGQSTVAMGGMCTAAGTETIALGDHCSASNSGSFAAGTYCAASAYGTVAIGVSNLANQQRGFATGDNALADRFAIHAHSGGYFAARGDAQIVDAVLRNKTTTNTGVEAALDGSTTYFTIPSGKVMMLIIMVCGVKSDGSASANFLFRYSAKNVSGTSSEVSAKESIGTDTASGCSVGVTTVDVGDYVSVKPVGPSGEIWRWATRVVACELAYGT